MNSAQTPYSKVKPKNELPAELQADFSSIFGDIVVQREEAKKKDDFYREVGR